MSLRPPTWLCPRPVSRRLFTPKVHPQRGRHISQSRILTSPAEESSDPVQPIFHQPVDPGSASRWSTQRINTHHSADTWVKAAGDPKQQLLRALSMRDPLRALDALDRISIDRQDLKFIPATTYNEIMDVLDPRHVLEQARTIHQTLSHVRVSKMRVKSLKLIFEEYFLAIQRLMDAKGAHTVDDGGQSKLNDYRFMLRATDVAGDGLRARRTWENMINAHIIPDTLCYNYYMSALCWAGVFLDKRRHSVRVTTRHMQERTELSFARHFRIRGYKVGKDGVRQRVLALYDEMLASGLTPDETTYTLVMTAAAREGDLYTIKSFLQNVWGLDLGRLLDGGEAPRPKQFPEDSPLRPTANLLYTVVHCFGSNYEVPTALRILDFLSEQYRIRIPELVWEQLLQWTYVSSNAIPHHTNRQKVLPRASVPNLWDMMRSEPYNIQPTFPMYDILFKSLARSGVHGRLGSTYDEGLAMLDAEREDYFKFRREKRGQDMFLDGLSQPREYARLALRRNHRLARTWTYLRLNRRTSKPGAERLDWERRGIPELIDQQYGPSIGRQKVSYGTTGGRVRLRLARENRAVSPKIKLGA